MQDAGQDAGIATRVAKLTLTLGAMAVIASPLHAQGPAVNEVQSVVTSAGPVSVQNLAGDLNHPWGMAFLPDGRLLLTERAGHLRILGQDGKLSKPLAGTPEVWAHGQGGLMDVALDPDFTKNNLVYISFAAPGPNDSAATALGRGRLVDDRIEGFGIIFRQKPWITGPNHFGNRIVFDGKGHVFLALGERFQFEPAQQLDNHLGKVVRLKHDGSVPTDNPFVDQDGALPEIWSYGHRNIEAALFDPRSDQLWVVEMGPLGGDELNRVEAGKNYGWPVVSWGMNYDGSDIPDPPTRPEFADSVKQFTPVISPAGMVLYDGDKFPAWRGSFLIGGLSGHQIARLKIDGEKVAEEERIPLPERIRDVEQGPDGNIYVLTSPKRGSDLGNVWRLQPLAPGN